MVPHAWETQLSQAELALVRRIAERDGVSIEQAASRLASEALARRVKKRASKGKAARVYRLKRPT